MEAQTTPTAEATPTPAPATTPTPAPTPAPQMEEGGAIHSITSGKMNWLDITISIIFIGVGALGALYFRKAYKKLDDQVSGEEFDKLAGKVDEHDWNLKRALGNKYKKK